MLGIDLKIIVSPAIRVLISPIGRNKKWSTKSDLDNFNTCDWEHDYQLWGGRYTVCCCWTQHHLQYPHPSLSFVTAVRILGKSFSGAELPLW